MSQWVMYIIVCPAYLGLKRILSNRSSTRKTRTRFIVFAEKKLMKIWCWHLINTITPYINKDTTLCWLQLPVNGICWIIGKLRAKLASYQHFEKGETHIQILMGFALGSSRIMTMRRDIIANRDYLRVQLTATNGDVLCDWPRLALPLHPLSLSLSLSLPLLVALLWAFITGQQ